MNLLSSIITYVRRFVKTPNNQVLTDNLIIDYINRFWLMDVNARMQLFDLKTTYQFQMIPGIDTYNMPLYNVQTEPGGDAIAWFPVYQGFMNPARINGINIPLYTQTSLFYNLWPNYVQQQIQVATGNGTNGPYTINLPFFPLIPGHVDMTGIIAYANEFGTNQDPIFVTNTQIANNDFFIECIPTTSVLSGVYFIATNANGTNNIVADSGEFLESGTGGNLYGLLMQPGTPPGGLDVSDNPIANGNTPLPFTTEPARYSTTLNTINYNTGQATFYFPAPVPDGTPIQSQCYYYQSGIPRSVLFYNNTLTFRPPPNTQYLVDLECYLTPAAFLTSSDAIPFGYMAEYIALGAARKILYDTVDIEQFNFYEPIFREQETLVHIRSQRQWTATRTDTIFSNTGYQSNYNQSSVGM
jgi:hypothetical protein